MPFLHSEALACSRARSDYAPGAHDLENRDGHADKRPYCFWVKRRRDSAHRYGGQSGIGGEAVFGVRSVASLPRGLTAATYGVTVTTHGRNSAISNLFSPALPDFDKKLKP